jgi:competence protein ComEC
LVVGLFKTPLRWSGLAIAALAVVWAAGLPRPDVLLSADGRIFAVRGADGVLAFHHTGGDTFAVKEWLAADADARDYHDRGLGAGIACDPSGCIGRLGDGRLVAYDLNADAFEEDCRRAAVILTPRDPPPGCAALVIGRNIWRDHGALALHRTGAGFAVDSARSANFDRPWAPARRHDTASANVPAPAAAGAAPRDATPKPEDIEADQ